MTHALEEVRDISEDFKGFINNSEKYTKRIKILNDFNGFSMT